jgi:hypothetical protein
LARVFVHQQKVLIRLRFLLAAVMLGVWLRVMTGLRHYERRCAFAQRLSPWGDTLAEALGG